MQLLPSEITKTTSGLRMLALYGNVLPSMRSFDVELDLWQNKWSGDSEQAKELDTHEKALPFADHDYYPNIRTLILILATVPITTCECERSISMLRLVKTALRSTMTETRLNGLAMLQYHRDILLTADEVVQEFVCRHPRRVLVDNPLNFLSQSTVVPCI